MALRVSSRLAGVLKTWQWLAPEVISVSSESSGYDEKSDIFSLGIILWELASLSIPYDEYQLDPKYYHKDLGEWKLQDIKTAIVEENLRPTIPDDCPTYFAEIISKCWEPDPNERISAFEITRTLEKSCSFLKDITRKPGCLVYVFIIPFLINLCYLLLFQVFLLLKKIYCKLLVVTEQGVLFVLLNILN